MSGLSRRQFLQRLIVLTWGAVASDLLAACAPAANSTATPPAIVEPSAPTSAAPATPTSVVPAIPTLQAETGLPRATVSPSAMVAPTATAATGSAYLTVVHGAQPAEITQQAIAALGGIERFVKPGADVIIKPNICIASYTYEYAATTNPEVVATLVRLCLGAGARRVRVMDQPFSGTPDAAYARSGIAEAVAAAGGQMEIMAPMKFREVAIPAGKDLKRWKIYGDVLDADVVINVPIAKHHGLSRLTLAGKNLMGVVTDREAFHRNLGQRLADVASLVRPELTVIDAIRILMNNGPTGGNLNDVKLTNTIIASTDMVAADTYATRLFGVQPADISYILASAKMKLGTMDLSRIKIEEVQID